ncbi:MAG: hypothetical protein JNL83_16885 [Myxococcales bacterium]|nr:hypothetical protein [Myxococcales bacterium]
MSGIWKGALLGIVNVLVIAIGIAMFVPDPLFRERYPNVAQLVFAYGSVPGLFGGACLGVLASALDRSALVLRLAVLTLPALGLVYALASAFDMTSFALVSCIPTIVAALILERWTRRPADPPPVPVARSVR